ncbi:O-antigen ligase family protein [Bacillus cereus]|uniref:O-antigen ligase family protein n=1 Tax=Bacillus cereus TaxID=1396 RepID=UPI000BF6A7EE|nr:O-antigen ligase family protein [Bacillus cereus]PEX88715.1 hypothetical protein CN450_14550 [Bacillus cereus]
MSIYKQSSIKGLFILPGLMLIFSMLVFPTSYQQIKIFLLIVVSLELLVWFFYQKAIPIKIELVLFILFVNVVSGFFILLGAFRGEPGAFRVTTVYLLWPIVFLILFSSLVHKEIIIKLFKVFIYALMAISLYSFMYIGHALGVVPDALYIEFDLGQNIGFYDGFMEYALYSISSLIFLIPFCIAGLFVWDAPFYKELKISKKSLFIVTGLGVISAILSGRRALWLVIALSVFIVFLLHLIIEKKNQGRFIKKVVWGVVLFLVIVLCAFPILSKEIDLNFLSLLNQFNFDAGPERNSQLEALMNGWLNHPLFGNGHGAVATVIRSEEMPWAYELQYADVLFKTGIVGFAVYSLSGIWVILKLISLAKKYPRAKMIIIPILTALIAFLIANATNPYLLKFDYIWILLFPIGVINYYLLKNNKIMCKEEANND